MKVGLFKNYTGSSVMAIGDKYVCATVDGPLDSNARDDDFESLNIDARCKVFSSSKSFENLCNTLISKILNKYIVKDSLMFKTIQISMYSNVTDLYLICNTVTAACLDAGIPLCDMIYCVGSQPMFVFRNDVIDFYHSNGAVTDAQIQEAKDKKITIENDMKKAFRNVFTI